MRPFGSAQQLEARRLVAARLFALKKTLAEVAEACGVSLSAAKLWKRAWKESGVAGLIAKPHPGPAPRLSTADLERLKQFLLAGARQAGYDSDLWTCARVAEVISVHFEVDYHPCHVWKILRKLGWTCQKPERRARERDEAAIVHWRKVEWPRIKKGGVAAKLSSRSWMKAALCCSHSTAERGRRGGKRRSNTLGTAMIDSR